MFIKVSAAEFKSAVERVVTGKKSIVNFTVQEDVLLIQKVGSVIADLRVNLLEPATERVSITVELTGLVNLIKTNKPIDILITKQLLNIKQDDLQVPYESKYEERVDIDDVQSHIQGEFSISELNQLQFKLREFEKFAKVLKVGESMVRLDGEHALVSYNNVIYKQNLKFHPMIISPNQVRGILKSVSGLSGKIKYNVDTNRNILYFDIGRNEKVYLLYSPVTDVTAFSEFDEIYSSMTVAANITTEIKEDLDILLKSINPTQLDVTIFERSMTVSILSDYSARIGRIDGNRVFTIRLSTVQLLVFLKTFDGNILVKKGDSKVLWEQSNKVLMMSGLVL